MYRMNRHTETHTQADGCKLSGSREVSYFGMTFDGVGSRFDKAVQTLVT